MQAIRYHRFSSRAQDKGSSLVRQNERTQALCERKGWTIIETVEDKGASAWKGDHLASGKLGELRRRIDAGLIAAGTVLVVENLDRLSRQDYRTARRWIEDVTDRDIAVQVYSPELWLDREAMSGSNIGAIVQHLLEANRASAESTRKSEFQVRNIARMLDMVRAGVCPSPRVPAWFEAKVGEPLTVNEPRAALVRLIYEWSASGLGYETICKTLNANHAPWTKTPWAINYVRDILSSPSVEGKYVVRTGQNRKPTGEIITGYYPRIVDADLVDRARAGIKSRNRVGGPKSGDAKNLFAGLVKCKLCSGTVGRVAGGDPALGHAYFVCRNSRYGLCANKAGMSYRVLETAVLDNLLHLALDDTHFSSVDEIGPLVSQMADAKSAIDTLTTGQTNLLRVLRMAPDSIALVNELQQIEQDLSEARGRLRIAEDKLAVARGAVSPEVHLSRVKEVSSSLGTSAEARRMVRDALPTIIREMVWDGSTMRVSSPHFFLDVGKDGSISGLDIFHPRHREGSPDYARRRDAAIAGDNFLPFNGNRGVTSS